MNGNFILTCTVHVAVVGQGVQLSLFHYRLLMGISILMVLAIFVMEKCISLILYFHSIQWAYRYSFTLTISRFAIHLGLKLKFTRSVSLHKIL